jgi:hypothetical protein
VEETHPGEITGVGAPDLQEEINHEMDQWYGSRVPELNLHVETTAGNINLMTQCWQHSRNPWVNFL